MPRPGADGSLLQRYTEDLQKNAYRPDAMQQQAIVSLQHLLEALTHTANNPRNSILRMLGGRQHIPGIYLWGGVGRGKTYLMDLFYESLGKISRSRVHFHKFMLDIHEQLRVLPKSPNPLMIIGKSLAARYRVLCIDEFHVTDVADAMLLSGLLRALFKNGVTLVVTSNTRIDKLYLNGLQRERFMEAIKLLGEHLVEIDLKAGQDFRKIHLVSGDCYLQAGPEALQQMLDKFNALSSGCAVFNTSIEINSRAIKTLGLSEPIIWFEFQELCDTARAAKDYLEIARRFNTVFLSDIPVLGDAQDSAAKRFMHLVDALYDHRVKLVASAAQAPPELYQGRLLQGTFDRTSSRLIEMSSADYLGMAHRP